MARGVRAIVLAAVVALFVSPSLAHASVIPMDLPGLTRAADAVLEVHVTGSAGRKGQGAGAASPHARVVTDTRIRVTRVHKGSRPDEFTLTQPGGTLDGITVRYAELPELNPGDTAIVFLDEHGLVGGAQGYLEIEGGRVPALDLGVAEVRARIRDAIRGESSVTTSPVESESAAPAMRIAAAASVEGVETVRVTAAAEEPAAGEKVTAAAGTVVVSTVSPARVDAGIDERITITGSGFSPASGVPIVEFLRGDRTDGTRVGATVLTYTSTSITAIVPRLAQGDTLFVSDALRSATATAFVDVGFSASPGRWMTSPVTYRINENSVDLSGEGAAVRRAFDTWNGAFSNLTLAYGGACSSTTNPVYIDDGYNDIYFASSGFVTGILAWNIQTYVEATGEYLESDIVLNDAFLWADGAVSGRFDVESTVLHELGHTFSLDDQYLETDEVMGAARSGTTRRALTRAETEGAQYQYGSRDVTPPAVPSVVSSTHPDPASWYATRTASFELTSTDARGVAGYSFVFDGAPATVPSTATYSPARFLTYTGVTDGVRYLHVRAMDVSGNWSTTRHFTVRVDLTRPITTADARTQYPGDARITLQASDAHAGVASTLWRLNGGPWREGRSVVATTPGEYLLEYRSVDAAGNSEDVKSAAFTTGAGAVIDDSSAWLGATGIRRSVSATEALGDRYLELIGPGSSVRFAFKGTAFAVRGIVAPGTGPLLLTVDGNAPRAVSSRGIGLGELASVTGLSDTTHTVLISVAPRSTQSPARWGVDSVNVLGGYVAWVQPQPIRFGPVSPSVSWTGPWMRVRNAAGAVSHRAVDAPGARSHLTFSGTAVSVTAPTGPSMGVAAIRVDGGARTYVDLSARSPRSAVVFRAAGLGGGTHTITVEWTGKRGVGAATAIAVESFSVEPFPAN